MVDVVNFLTHSFERCCDKVKLVRMHPVFHLTGAECQPSDIIRLWMKTRPLGFQKQNFFFFENAT